MATRSVLDVDYPRALLAGLLVVLVLAVGYAASTSGTAFGAYNARWDGSADLRAQAGSQGAEVLLARNTSAYDEVTANGTVAFVLAPERRYSDRDIATLRTFVRDGGTLVVADDATPPRTGDRLLARFGTDVEFRNATLRDERYHYRAPPLPVARNVSNTTLTREMETLTLNYGTALRPGNATVLVNTSGYAYLDRDGSETVNGNESLGEYTVAVRERVGAGQVVAVSDPSVFINAMLDREGNERFVANLVGPHERVLMDYSHATALPPLVGALLTLRDSATLQFLLGVLGIVVVVGWGRGLRAWLAAAIETLRRSEDDFEQLPDADAADIAAYLRQEHPDWDDERIERLAEAAARDD